MRETEKQQRTRNDKAAMKLLAKVLLAAGFVLVLAADLPGHMSYDSVLALYQVRYGVGLTYQPPLMNVILRLSDAMIHSPALFVTIDALLFFASLIALVCLARAVWAWVIPACVLAIANPLVLVTQGNVWHDVLFADLSVAGFCSLAWSLQDWKRRPRSYAALAAALVFLVLATFARQNGVICLITAFVVLCVTVLREPNGKRMCAGFGIAAVVFVAAINAALSAFGANASYASGLKVVQSYDIVGMASNDPRIDLSPLTHGDQALERMIVSQARAFSPVRVDEVEAAAPQLWSFLMAQPQAKIASAWREIVTANPGDYLRTRLVIYSWLVFTPDVSRCLPLFVGVDGRPEWLRALGLREGMDARDRALLGYSIPFFHTPLFSHVFYAVLSGVLMALLLWRRRPADAAIAGMLAAALLVTASYFFVAIACSFRYVYLLDMSGLAALIYYCADPALSRSEPTTAVGAAPPGRSQ